MNYGQFLQMMPEVILVVMLICVFFCDMLTRGNERRALMGSAVIGPLVYLIGHILIISPRYYDNVSAFGGMYVSNSSVSAIKAILTFGALVVLIMAYPWLDNKATKGRSINGKYAGEFIMLVLSTLLGMFMMVSSGNFLMFFLGLEMASVPMSCLVAFDKWKKISAESAAKYIITAIFSSGVMLYGISFVYGSAGTLYFDDVAQRFAFFAQYKSQVPMLIMGMVFFFSGLGFKLSLVPFHFWTADTYEGAPTPVTGYLSVCSKGAAAFALMTILMKVFGSLMEYWEYMLYVVIVLSITIANLFAIRQKELKRFMAFSSISPAGYIMLAVVGASQSGMASLMYYILVYVVANMAVFTVISAVENSLNAPDNRATQMSTYNGLYQTNPKLAFLMTLALFSLAGIPPFAGMFSKFFVFMAAAEQGSFWAYFVVFIALINTVVSLYYYLLIVKAMYIKSSDSPLPTFRTDGMTRLALTICTAGIVLFGVCSCIYEWLFANSVM